MKAFHKLKHFSFLLLLSLQLSPSFAETQTTLLEGSVEYSDKTENYPIDLEVVLRLVEKQNLSFAQDKMQAKINKSLLRESQVALLPDVVGTYTQSRLSGATQVFGGQTVTVVRPTVNPQAAISWTINPGGAQIFTALAARQRMRASEAQAKGTLQDQMTGAAQEYYKLKASLAQKEATLKSLEQAREQLKLSEAKFNVGNGTKLDVMNAKKLEAQQLQSLIQAQNAIVQAEQNLLTRLNLDPNIHLVINAEADQKALVSNENKILNLIERAKRNSPVLKRLELELKALQDDFKSLAANIIPTVTLRANVGKTGPSYDQLNRTDFASFTATANLLNSLGLEIPFQLQEKGREIEKKKLEMKAQERTLENQVTTAYLSSRNYLEAINATQAGLEAADEAYRLAIKRYEAGYSNSLEISQAQVDLAKARLDSINALLNYNQAQVQLLQSLGEVDVQNLLSGVN
jgi:outer membrane protein TolC